MYLRGKIYVGLSILQLFNTSNDIIDHKCGQILGKWRSALSDVV